MARFGVREIARMMQSDITDFETLHEPLAVHFDGTL
jgi:hypothetical protein